MFIKILNLKNEVLKAKRRILNAGINGFINMMVKKGEKK